MESFVSRPLCEKGKASPAPKLPKQRGLEAALGEKLPDPPAALAVKYAAAVLEEQRMSFHMWAPGHASVALMIETLSRLDRPTCCSLPQPRDRMRRS